MNSVALGFVPEPRLVELGLLLPSRKVPSELASSRKYRQIKSSIEEIGLIEPLSVTEADKASGLHMVLDGHIRLVVLKALEQMVVPCLIATDDESYTYNNRVNHLSSVQEHLMIRRAIARGVSAERLARTLSVDVTHIVKKANLLDGICPEAVELLRDRRFSAELGRVLRRMKPTRQVECIELMVAANNLSVSYGQALMVATPNEMLVEGKKPSNLTGVSPEQIARMEREMANLQGQYKLVEQSYGQDVLSLVLVKGYVAKLIGNERISRLLRQRYRDLFEQFESIAATTSLEQ